MKLFLALIVVVTLLSAVAWVPHGNRMAVRNGLMMSTKERVKTATSPGIASHSHSLLLTHSFTHLLFDIDNFRPKEGTSTTNLVNDPVYSFGKNQIPKKLTNTKQVLGN